MSITTKYTENILTGCGPTRGASSPMQTACTALVWAYDTDDTNDYSEIATGGNASSGISAGIATNGRLYIWGRGFNGELGNNTSGTTACAVIPTQTIGSATTWKHVSIGTCHVAAIKTDGTLWTWGSGAGGALGQNLTANRSSPVQTISGGTDWKQVSAGGCRTAAIKTDGTLWTWGSNSCGSLGDGTVTNRSSPVQTVAGGNDWKQVSTNTVIGGDFTAAVKTDGTLWLWGSNSSCKLGVGGAISGVSSPIQTIAGGNDWKQVSVGAYHTAAVKTDGTLWTWGSNSCGSLGDGTTSTRSSPVQTIAGGTNWKQVSAFTRGTAATKTDGTLWIWGDNGVGQLGTNNKINSCVPVQTFIGGTNWEQVGQTKTTRILAVKDNNTLWTWGSGYLGSRSSYIGRVDLGDLLISKGDLIEYYPELDDRIKRPALWGWGQGTCGRLGDNNTVNRSSPVQTISGGTNWKQVSAGYLHTAAIKTDGTLWTWGCNDISGQLGDGTVTNRLSPVQTVAGGTNWKQVSAGNCHTAAIKTDGTLWLWGEGANGRLGTLSPTDRSSPVQTHFGGNNWKQVSAGVSHTAAIKTDGSLCLWGLNTTGELGDGTIASRSQPVQTISGGTNWKQVSAGRFHTAAVKTDGTLWTWGCNIQGQLGDETLIARSSPVQVSAGTTNWKQVSAGTSVTAAIKTDGTLWLWGSGSNGLLGTNNTVNSSFPVQTVSGGNNWKDVCVSALFDGNSVAAIKTDGTLWAWGQGTCGRLGNGTVTNRSSPVQTIAGGTNWVQLGGTFAISETGDW